MSKTRKMLSNWDIPCIQSFVNLIKMQTKPTLATWALEYAQQYILPLWSKYYTDDLRPQNALNAAWKWLLGTIKLPEVKTAILQCHKAALEADKNPAAQAAARAIGQSASTIHSARHCIGFIQYGTMAIVYDILGTKANWGEIARCADTEYRRMSDTLRAIALKNSPNPTKINRKC